MALNRNQLDDLYALLGVSPQSTLHEIKSAYRKMSLESHPDRGGSNERQARINHAYHVLSDPARRRRYDRAAAGGKPARGHESGPRFRSKHAAEWERGFGAVRPGGIRARAAKEEKSRSEEIRSGQDARVETEYSRVRMAFLATRTGFIASALTALIFAAAGCIHPVLLSGVPVAGYALYRCSRHGTGDDALGVLDAEWEYKLKKAVRERIRRETGARLSSIAGLGERVDRLIFEAKRPSAAKHSEKSILRRAVIHFFLMGHEPVAFDRHDGVVIMRAGSETSALRCRHRSGGPLNTALVSALHRRMEEYGACRGYLVAAPGLSKKAAAFADDHLIAYYSLSELNSWIAGFTARRYHGPEGNLAAAVDSLTSFLDEIG